MIGRRSADAWRRSRLWRLSEVAIHVLVVVIALVPLSQIEWLFPRPLFS